MYTLNNGQLTNEMIEKWAASPSFDANGKPNKTHTGEILSYSWLFKASGSSSKMGVRTQLVPEFNVNNLQKNKLIWFVINLLLILVFASLYC